MDSVQQEHRAGPGPTREERCRQKIEHAHDVAQWMLMIGWVVAAIGVVSLLTIGGLLIAGEIGVEAAASAAFGATLASILSGVVAYGSGMNLDLGAERLELALAEASSATRAEVAGSGG